MKHLNIRDAAIRKQYGQYYIRRVLIQSLLQSTEVSATTRFRLQTQLNRFPRNSSKTRMKNRCVESGRSRSVYRKLKLSRLCFRERAAAGKLVGFYKASW